MKDKVKVEFDRDVLNDLLKLKQVGDTYSDVVRQLLKEKEETKKVKS
jgi:predicted CopG family antitoxin